MEKNLSYVLFAGLALTAMGFLWLVLRAFRAHKAWGIASLFPPFAFVFAVWKSPHRGPLLTLLLGGLLTAAPFGVNYYYTKIAGHGPVETKANGESHLTLTNWDQKDYSILKGQMDLVVLQMANPDVTDETLQFIKHHKLLKEVDLNDTQITDAGLAILATLPALESLRLKGAKITDQGFRDHLLPLDGLKELDLRNTPVKGETVRAWKAAKPDRKALK